MIKGAKLTGQPVFTQLLNLIDRRKIVSSVAKFDSDKRYRTFKTYDHLITMLYCIFHKCTSLREVTTGMQVCYTKLKHLGMNHSPRRSTFSDANQRRDPEVFETIYHGLYHQYHKDLPDSRNKSKWFSRLYIVDSTTISLFKDILKNAGRTPVNGKRKGGIKVHTLIKADEDVPSLINLNCAASHDVPFIKGLQLPKGSIVVFDKAYIDYAQYKLWSEEQVSWVCRLKKSSIYEVIEEKQITLHHEKHGIISDQLIVLGHTSHENITRVKARLITFWDSENEREFKFITNQFTFSPLTICQIYKQRWQIELLFKRIKSNYPLQYFLGDNENAIKIQIWCTLIADLLIKIIQSTLKRKWAFSNLVSMIRIHLMTYTGLLAFLENPEKMTLSYDYSNNKDPTLF